MNKDFEEVFKNIIKKANKIVEKKKKKYPMLDLTKIKTFLVTWTLHYLDQQKKKKEKKNLKMAFYGAIIVFETSCNLAIEKLNQGN